MPTPTRDPREIDILIADRDSDAVGETRRALHEIGMRRSVSTGSGLLALLLIKINPIGLLLLDPALQHRDGFWLLGELRSIPRFNPPRVILTTASASRDLIQRAVGLEVNEYLVKPFNSQTLRQKIERVLGGRLPDTL